MSKKILEKDEKDNDKEKDITQNNQMLGGFNNNYNFYNPHNYQFNNYYNIPYNNNIPQSFQISSSKFPLNCNSTTFKPKNIIRTEERPKINANFKLIDYNYIPKSMRLRQKENEMKNENIVQPDEDQKEDPKNMEQTFEDKKKDNNETKEKKEKTISLKGLLGEISTLKTKDKKKFENKNTNFKNNFNKKTYENEKRRIEEQKNKINSEKIKIEEEKRRLEEEEKRLNEEKSKLEEEERILEEEEKRRIEEENYKKQLEIEEEEKKKKKKKEKKKMKQKIMIKNII